jgi:hypothetical protein
MQQQSMTFWAAIVTRSGIQESGPSTADGIFAMPSAARPRATNILWAHNLISAADSRGMASVIRMARVRRALRWQKKANGIRIVWTSFRKTRDRLASGGNDEMGQKGCQAVVI